MGALLFDSDGEEEEKEEPGCCNVILRFAIIHHP